jgi:hypothetical protein
VSPDMKNDPLTHLINVKKMESIDSFQRGIVETIVPIMTELDERILATRKSQHNLSQQLVLLQQQLNSFAGKCHAPPGHNQEFDALVKRIDQARRRLIQVNTVLSGQRDRLDNALNALAFSKRSSFV